ncbi:hypothetical protein KA517_00010 [Candidatus Gracilibacteria bacterium]|nr:hypothetical protein [Candidatus Gracilibacteria bacterium]
MKTAMRWANFFHMYQPAQQQPDILEAIVAQSYRLMLQGLIDHPDVRLTININGSLLELFDRYGHQDLIEMLRSLGLRKQVEFTGTAKYHALLPFLNEREVERQIVINQATLEQYLGKANKPKGFFPTEMAYDKKLLPIIEALGFEWLIVDEIACGGEVGKVDHQTVYDVADSKLQVFFRNRQLSNVIMSGAVRTGETFLDIAHDHVEQGDYVVTAMDFETFGHHRPGLEQSIFAVFAAADVALVQISDLAMLYPRREQVTLVHSTWATSPLDIRNHSQFLSWSDPENVIHSDQWALTELALQAVYTTHLSEDQYQLVRNKMDIALASDHFWWASAKPWWSVPMIEDGAFRLLDTLENISDLDRGTLEKGRALYHRIVTTAFAWQRTGKIHQMMVEQGRVVRIPFQDRDDMTVYPVLIELMQRLEKEATVSREYEKAILWRDAIHKLENKLDAYDAVHAIELLKLAIPETEITAMLEKYKTDYAIIRGGQPEQRGA